LKDGRPAPPKLSHARITGVRSQVKPRHARCCAQSVTLGSNANPLVNTFSTNAPLLRFGATENLLPLWPGRA
jgi:hypothetical protein